MTPQMRLKKQQLADLQCLREIGEAGIRQIDDAVAQLPIAPLQPTEFRGKLKTLLAENDGAADAVLRTLLSLHGLMRQLDLTSDEIFAGLNSAVREADWNAEDLKKWEQAAEAFKGLFHLPVVRLSAKALELSYQHAHLLQRSQIVTDIRPLFDQEAKEIQGTIISHKLLLRYDDLEGEHLLSLAVDEKDILSLIKQCERALQKSKTVQSQLKDRAQIQTLIPGKDE
jgi:hypothetical protein